MSGSSWEKQGRFPQKKDPVGLHCSYREAEVRGEKIKGQVGIKRNRQKDISLF